MFWQLYVWYHTRSWSITGGPRTQQSVHRFERQTTSRTTWDGKPKVTQPTDWVNFLVIREKENGRPRLCLDSKELNKAIKKEHHPIPTLDEIAPKLAGGKLFSKLDARNGYRNVKLYEESSYLTNFITPFGRCRFLRMPFGLRMSQDIFQFKIYETCRDCQGAIGGWR